MNVEVLNRFYISHSSFQHHIIISGILFQVKEWHILGIKITSFIKRKSHVKKSNSHVIILFFVYYNMLSFR